MLHRIIAEKDGLYTLCGDNQLNAESGIPRERIIAEVSGVLRGEKKRTVNGGALYRLLWRSFLFRRIYFKLRLILTGKRPV